MPPLSNQRLVTASYSIWLSISRQPHFLIFHLDSVSGRLFPFVLVFDAEPSTFMDGSEDVAVNRVHGSIPACEFYFPCSALPLSDSTSLFSCCSNLIITYYPYSVSALNTFIPLYAARNTRSFFICSSATLLLISTNSSRLSPSASRFSISSILS